MPTHKLQADALVSLADAMSALNKFDVRKALSKLRTATAMVQEIEHRETMKPRCACGKEVAK